MKETLLTLAEALQQLEDGDELVCWGRYRFIRNNNYLEAEEGISLYAPLLSSHAFHKIWKVNKPIKYFSWEIAKKKLKEGKMIKEQNGFIYQKINDKLVILGGDEVNFNLKNLEYFESVKWHEVE